MFCGFITLSAQALKLPPYTSFEQLGINDKEARAALREVGQQHLISQGLATLRLYSVQCLYTSLSQTSLPSCHPVLQVYSNDINKIDATVGLLSETPLPGWIFGEAIYTIFVLQVRLLVTAVEKGQCDQSLLVLEAGGEHILPRNDRAKRLKPLTLPCAGCVLFAMTDAAPHRV